MGQAPGIPTQGWGGFEKSHSTQKTGQQGPTQSQPRPKAQLPLMAEGRLRMRTNSLCSLCPAHSGTPYNL